MDWSPWFPLLVRPRTHLPGSVDKRGVSKEFAVWRHPSNIFHRLIIDNIHVERERYIYIDIDIYINILKELKWQHATSGLFVSCVLMSEWPHKSSLTRCRRTAWKPWIETSWPLHQQSISCSWSTPPSPFREASTSFPDFQINFQIFQITQLYGSIMQHANGTSDVSTRGSRETREVHHAIPRTTSKGPHQRRGWDTRWVLYKISQFYIVLWFMNIYDLHSSIMIFMIFIILSSCWHSLLDVPTVPQHCHITPNLRVASASRCANSAPSSRSARTRATWSASTAA